LSREDLEIRFSTVFEIFKYTDKAEYTFRKTRINFREYFFFFSSLAF
jgi:hypothetical protein